MKSAVAAEIAALAAWRVLGVGDRIGAMIFDDEQCYHFTPRRSREAVIDILKRLETANAALVAGRRANAKQINIAFDALLRHVTHDALVICIGDGFGWDENSDEMLKLLSLHNDVVAIDVFDPAERGIASAQGDRGVGRRNADRGVGHTSGIAGTFRRELPQTRAAHA